MTKLLEKEYSKNDLFRYSGNIQQIGGIHSVSLKNGKADGIGAYIVKTGSGLEYTVLSDRGMDISSLSYHGVNVSYLAKPGIISSQYGYPADGEFGRYITGGMLFTCGLRNVGEACLDHDGQYHPPHGRISVTPAENPYAQCYWNDNDYIMEMGGTMKDSMLFGHNLSLTRKIISWLGKNELLVEDTLENNSPVDEEFMLLYHCNYGFPFLNEATRLYLPENTAKSAEKDVMENNPDSNFTKPQDSFPEQVIFRDIEPDSEGNIVIRVENPLLGFGVYIEYKKKNLPNLVQWKSMQSGDYVLGIEPCNCYIKGRKNERNNGTIQKIPAFSKMHFQIKIGIYDLQE